MKLTFIVNGTETNIRCSKQATLKKVAESVLKNVGNVRPVEDYSIICNGIHLSPSLTIEDQDECVSEKSIIFLSLKVAFGGVNSKKELTVIQEKKYIIKQTKYSNGSISVSRENTGFSVFELLGMLTVATDDMLSIVKENVSPPNKLIIKERVYNLENK